MKPKALSAILGHSAERMIRELGASLTTERYGQAGVYALLAQEIRKVAYKDEDGDEGDDVPWPALSAPTKQQGQP